MMSKLGGDYSIVDGVCRLVCDAEQLGRGVVMNTELITWFCVSMSAVSGSCCGSDDGRRVSME